MSDLIRPNIMVGDSVNLKDISTDETGKPEGNYIYKFEIMGVAPTAGYTTTFISEIKDDEERKAYVTKVINRFIERVLEQESKGRQFIPDSQVVSDRIGFIKENYKLDCYYDSEEFTKSVKENIFK